ncbi:hypothetical protein EC973_000124 [Apophysomyces ossiformis]|uniref:Uncharacterized protein n=1 Tax=Apophysomyces ossiformis TaxID=679940 RepID=A0A8H7ETW8_9FUNG|nr:hypothetical protein EC973_000124 [Apophysomyces ossiformis]
MYCYGGIVNASVFNYPAPSLEGFYELDISHDLTLNQVQTGWTQLQGDVNATQKYNFTLEANADFAIVTVPHQAFVLNGGAGQGVPIIGAEGGFVTTLLNHETTRFNGESWDAIFSGGIEQYLGQTGNYIASKQSIYYWGGWNLSRNRTADAQFRLLNYTTLQWSSSPYAPLPENPIIRYRHTATLVGDDKIYFIGGTSGYGANDSISMQDILIYDTTVDKWNLTKSQGSVTPSERSMHTTTWTNSYTAVPDYCYTYDIDRNQWTQHNLQGQSGAGQLYGHSAVLIGNSTLFILFGIGSLAPPSNSAGSMYILNLTSMAWTDQYKASALDYVMPKPSKNSTIPQPTHAPPEEDGSKTRTIIGAVVGSVVGVALIGLGIGIYLFIRRRRAKRASDESSTQGHEKDATEFGSTDNKPDDMDKSTLTPSDQQEPTYLEIRGSSPLWSPIVDKPLSQSPLTKQRPGQWLYTDKRFPQSHPLAESMTLSPLVDKPFLQSDSQVSLAEKPDSGEGRSQPVKPDAACNKT